MEKLSRWIVAALLLAALGIVQVGCEQEGPAERAGEKIDQAVEEAGDKVEKATD
ncbi:MAG TPA: hypothetical protein VLT88_07980 [Desulfosarcina sp.]|nr:hypothetical protein [Desulfosarcina sp.]